jgi:CRISPR system Cascade subunit CasA
LNAFDDTSSKPKGKADDGGKLPSPGAGYLGKLGMIVLEGGNLFETLMLNFVLADDRGDAFPIGTPAWEEDVHRGERVLIMRPESMAELLTIQSRRISLIVNENRVMGYRLLGGDFFETDNAFIEQMTLWRKDKSAKRELYKPRRHNAEKQFWRDFSALISGEEGRRPGVLSWFDILQYRKILDSFQTNISIAGIEYGDKDFFVDGIISDSISINSGVLSDLGENWTFHIIEVLKLTDKAVIALGELSSDIALALGADNEKSQIAAIRKPVRVNAYFELDGLFRDWLKNLRPDQNRIDEINEWKQIAKKCLLRLGEQIVSEAPDRAFVGRYRAMNNTEILYCTSRAHKWFLWGKSKEKIGVMKLFATPGDKSKDIDTITKEKKEESANEPK